MSMHKIPLNKIEEEGLKHHGLDIGKPSQLSDAFRLGVTWGMTKNALRIEELEAALNKCAASDYMGDVRDIVSQTLNG